MLTFLYLHFQLRVVCLDLPEILIQRGCFPDLGPFVQTNIASLLTKDLHALGYQGFYLVFELFNSLWDFHLNWLQLFSLNVSRHIGMNTSLTTNLVINLSMPSIIDNFFRLYSLDTHFLDILSNIQLSAGRLLMSLRLDNGGLCEAASMCRIE